MTNYLYFFVDCRRRVLVPGVYFIIIPMSYWGLWIIRSMIHPSKLKIIFD